jgi:hypothetical protein
MDPKDFLTAFLAAALTRMVEFEDDTVEFDHELGDLKACFRLTLVDLDAREEEETDE